MTINDELVSNASAGDSSALNEVVRYVEPSVRRIVEMYCCRVSTLRQANDLDDLVQTSLADMAVRIRSVQPQNLADVTRLAENVAHFQMRFQLHLIEEFPSQFEAEQTVTDIGRNLEEDLRNTPEWTE